MPPERLRPLPHNPPPPFVGLGGVPGLARLEESLIYHNRYCVLVDPAGQRCKQNVPRA